MRTIASSAVDQLGLGALLDADHAGGLEGDGSHGAQPTDPAYELAHLAQRARLGVEHEAADVLARGQLGAGAQAREAVAQRLLDVLEGAQPPRGHRAVGHQRLGELVLGGSAQAAAVVHHHDDLLGAEQALGGAERADRVVGDQAAGVADDVRVAALDPEHREQVDARVHARRAPPPCGAAAG